MRKQIEKVAQNVAKPLQHIRILVDDKTIVTVRDSISIEHWLKRFPAARIIPE
jgi:hypothetical protein